jgi:tetratricopeptide (TPR) repeat protein
MKRMNAFYLIAAFALGATTVLVAKTPKITFDSKAYYAGAAPKAAAAALLKEAEVLAKDDTWQRIGIGRVHLQSGDAKSGEALFQSVLENPKVGKGDIYRIATAYAAAKQWDKAKPLFERAIALDPGDDSAILRAGCWFNLNGDRARAEELFDKAFAHGPDDVWHYTFAAGSYLGVAPF